MKYLKKYIYIFGFDVQGHGLKLKWSTVCNIKVCVIKRNFIYGLKKYYIIKRCNKKKFVSSVNTPYC